MASLIHAKNPEHCFSSPVRPGIYRSCAPGRIFAGQRGLALEVRLLGCIALHPAYPGRKRCKALTSHLDVAPTLVSLTNASREKKTAITRNLAGNDLAPLLADPERAAYSKVRDGALYCYNMFAYIDWSSTISSAIRSNATTWPWSATSTLIFSRL